VGAAILQLGCTIKCPHGGTGSVVNTNTRVKVDGNFALLSTDTYTIAACPFTLPGPKSSPCVKVEWLAEATRVKVENKPVLLQTSVGLCKSAEQVVQGTAILSGVQTRVKGV
jgi:uncharacterized Zn-binding protein involved in type VI secretion